MTTEVFAPDSALKYSKWLDNIYDGTEVLTLENFAYWYAYDNNLVWRLGSGDLVNLLEEALDRLQIDYTSWEPEITSLRS